MPLLVCPHSQKLEPRLRGGTPPLATPLPAAAAEVLGEGHGSVQRQNPHETSPKVRKWKTCFGEGERHTPVGRDSLRPFRGGVDFLSGLPPQKHRRTEVFW